MPKPTKQLPPHPSATSETKSGTALATGTLEVIEPRALVPAKKKSVEQFNTFSEPEIESAIENALAQTEEHRRQSAIWDLRTGVLFHAYRESLQVAGRKYSGFWEKCEKRFSITRGTVSRKMRLAVTWAKEKGASEEIIHKLAEASDLTDTQNPALQLAFDWIGDQTTTDLYRKYKLVNYGPTGGDRRERDEEGNPVNKGKRTKAEIAREEFEAVSEVGCTAVKRQIDKVLAIRGPQDERAWWLLSDHELEELKLAAHDLHQGCLEAQNRRKLAARKVA